MKKAIIFLGGTAVGLFVGYAVGKRKAYNECEAIISDMRRKNKDDMRRLDAEYKKSIKNLGVNFVEKDTEGEFKKFKSLEEDDKLKEILGKKSCVLTEDEYDYLRGLKWDYDVVEYHTNKGVFTYTNGQPFTLFAEEGIEKEATDAVIKAPYEVGAYVCIKNSKERKVYEVVRIDVDDEDLLHEEGDDEPQTKLIDRYKGKVYEAVKSAEDDPFVIYDTELDMLSDNDENTELKEIYYDIDTNSYFSDPDKREEIEDPFNGKETFTDDGVFYVRDEIKNIDYILTVEGPVPDDDVDGIMEGETPEPPEFITEDEYAENMLGFDKKEVHYHMATKTYVDDENFIIDFPEKVFPRFNPKEGAEYYVRNYELETDYFIAVIPEDAEYEES